MIEMRYLVVTIILSLVLVSCSNHKDAIYNDKPLSEIYASANKQLQNGNYENAIHEFEILNNYSLSIPYAQQIQLDLTYAYYKASYLSLAQISIDRFLRFNPTHPNIDYALYMHGIISMALDDNAIQRFFGINRSDRDSQHIRTAFRYLKKLVYDHPNSRYSADAIKRLIYIKNRLAKYELSIVQYYNKYCAYIAVINRVEKMLCDFPDTQATRQALPYMEHAYRELQLNEQADKVTKIILLNPAYY